MTLSYGRIMFVLTIIYGCSIPILYILEVPNIWKFAGIGAIVLGGLWALSGVFGGGKSRKTD